MGDENATTLTSQWPGLAQQLYPNRPDVIESISALLAAQEPNGASGETEAWSEHDAWVITYADQFQTDGQTPLASLRNFYGNHLRPWINGVHILPFHPWSSDDGYSVLDYTAVDPRFGSWSDVETLTAEARVMFDAVINHVSAGSRWFLGYLAGNPTYRDFFISLPADTDLKEVVRPRTTPLLTRFEASEGPTWVWTTFSSDQVDLNYRNPAVLLAVLEVMLDYAGHGAAMIRLDAMQFLWKEAGESSINMPQAHQVIQLLRSCMDEIYPGVVFVTETNVPHEENLSYFGQGQREAQMVYQFALPPLVLDALHTGSVEFLTSWIRGLAPLPAGRTFLNFLSSHDGVGVRPVEGILPESRINDLVELTVGGGGEVGVRSVGDTTETYELNTTWFSLMETGHTPEQAIDRHLASHAIMLALVGVPAIYALSLIGGRSDHAGYAATEQARSLNRTRLTTAELGRDLADTGSVSARVINGLEEMLRWRSSLPAFHPESPQTVLATPDGVLGIERGAEPQLARVYVNVTPQPIEIAWPGSTWTGFDVAPSPGAATIAIGPWQSVWLRKEA